MTSDAEPLSDTEYERVVGVVDMEGVSSVMPLHRAIEKLVTDARYHRARVRELQRQVEAARTCRPCPSCGSHGNCPPHAALAPQTGPHWHGGDERGYPCVEEHAPQTGEVGS